MISRAERYFGVVGSANGVDDCLAVGLHQEAQLRQEHRVNQEAR
jgi:hypothetical protein